jgi:glycosyltransferase involved in cell wall biosynthesis
LKIAGPDDGGHLDSVMSLIQELGVSSCVEYVGVVDGAEKSALYRGADLFVLPTFSENFGLVIAEALSYGVPVITTRGTPWSALEEFACGWWVDIGVSPLISAIRAAVQLSDRERQAMGVRGRRYVERYSWDGVAKQMACLYTWVVEHGARPPCVRIT